MTHQSSLFANPTEPPRDGYTRYEIEVAGCKVYADFNPKYIAGMAHIAFQSLEDRVPNPISETGYRSHFVDGSIEGMTHGEIVRALTAIAEEIIKE